MAVEDQLTPIERDESLLPAWIRALLSRPLVCFFIVCFCAAALRVVRFERWPGSACLSAAVHANEMSRIAQSLASRGTFSDPYLLPTGPTAHHAPIYPLILAAVYRLPQSAWISARAGLNILFSSLMCGCVLLAGIWLGFDSRLSFAAALLLALVPARLSVELCNDQESALAGVIVVMAIGLSARWLRRPQSSPVLLGAIWGFALLTLPVLALLCAAFFGVVLSRRNHRRRAVVALATVLLVLAPWEVRNRIVMGGWFFVRDTVGLELRVSNADSAVVDPNVNAEQGAMREYHPLFNRTAAMRIAQFGELNEFTRLGRDAIAWIVEHPARFWALTAERVRDFWLPIGTTRLALLRYLATWFIAAVGLWILFFRERLAAVIVAALLLLYPLPYYLTQSYARYAYPIEWALTLLGVYGAYEMLRYAASAFAFEQPLQLRIEQDA